MKLYVPSDRCDDRVGATFATRCEPAEHEHSVAEIAEHLGAQAVLLPDFGKLRSVDFNALASLLAPTRDGPRHRWEPLEVSGREPYDDVDVTPVEGINDALDDLQVLAGNTRSPAGDDREFARGTERRHDAAKTRADDYYVVVKALIGHLFAPIRW